MRPPARPEAILGKLKSAINETLRSPELVAAMDKIGFVPEPWTIAQYEDFLADEMKQWPGILQADRREDRRKTRESDHATRDVASSLAASSC